jgi:serine/threonine protein kinase
MPPIDLKNLNADEAKLLFDFFSAQQKIGISVWKAGTYQFQETQFTLANDVFRRETKDGGGVRYEIISNEEIGKGAFGTVRLIEGTLALNQVDVYKYKSREEKEKKGKSRVVKVQKHNEDLALLEGEYDSAKRATHLAMKKPTLEGGWTSNPISYAVMRRLPGRDLSHIVDDDLKKVKVLTIEQRIELSKLLLKTLKEQVTDKGLIHRDIKEENIMVEWGPPLIANIIDYGLSINTEQIPQARAGVEAYIAPEVDVTPKKTSVKSDVYSMGRVIARLWHADESTYSSPNPHAESEGLLPCFKDIPGLSEKDKKAIRSTLKGMLEYEPCARLSIDQAITAFESVGQQATSEVKGTVNEASQQTIGFNLNSILEKITHLNGKLGLFGGETRQLEDGSKIKVPKGAAAIFDLITEHKKSGDSLEDTLKNILEEAKKSGSRSHYFFNRQQSETAKFYQELVKDISETLPSENRGNAVSFKQ